MTEKIVCPKCGWYHSCRVEPAPTHTGGSEINGRRIVCPVCSEWVYVVSDRYGNCSCNKCSTKWLTYWHIDKTEPAPNDLAKLVAEFGASQHDLPPDMKKLLYADVSAPKEVPELPPEFNKHNFDCPYGSLVYISGFGAYVKANYGIMMELKYVDWLAACDKAGCTAESVVAKMREAGR